MKRTEAYKDSDSGFLGGMHMHPEEWRVYGNSAEMVDMSEHGPTSPAVDDMNLNDCEKKEWPDAPGFEGGDSCPPHKRSGAHDGARYLKRSSNTK